MRSGVSLRVSSSAARSRSEDSLIVPVVAAREVAERQRVHRVADEAVVDPGVPADPGLVGRSSADSARSRSASAVIRHQSQRNTNDEQTGVEALLPPLCRQGLKRLPSAW